MSAGARIGADAVAAKGWLRAHRWLILRRGSQLGILGLFLAGPVAGIWIVKGTLTSSLTLGVLPLTDPYVLLQTLAAGHVAASTALIGAAIVLAFYALIAGRAYCAWVCPLNMVTDAAHWVARRLDLPKGWRPRRDARLWLLGTTLAVAAITGIAAWELVNPVSLLHRGLVFGIGFGWTVVLAIFLFDLLVSRRGWCGHLCPMGAFYGLLGAVALLRISAPRRAACNDCMDCFAVCPEPQVIPPALRGASPVIRSGDCTLCGRCIDVCGLDVFSWGLRFSRPATPGTMRRARGSLSMTVGPAAGRRIGNQG